MPRYSRERVWLVFVLALVLCALVTVARHRPQPNSGSDPLTNVTRQFLFSPVLHLVNSLSSWWRDDVSSVFLGPSLARENRHLRNKIANLMQENRSLVDEADENVQLRELLYFKAHDPRDLLPAEVLALKPFSERDTAIFSRGQNNQVSEKQPALDSSGNLVGQVVMVTSDTCDVMLLTDTLSSVGARVVSAAEQPAAAVSPPAVSSPPALNSPLALTSPPSVLAPAAVPITTPPVIAAAASSATVPESVGVCVGDHSGLLQLTDLGPDATVAVGDTVVTSGLGGVYPKDIPIGKIVEVDFDKTLNLKYARVQPWADLNHLQEGFLLR